MTDPVAAPTKPAVTLAWFAAAVGVATAVVLAVRPGGAPSAPAPRGGTSAIRFVEGAEAAGVGFRMRFLPREQGEAFRINLYDHGAGLAIADVDGDGDDDLYFCNQLGPNALYRNDGGGRFTDVTATAGPVDVAGRISVAAAFGDVDGDGDRDLYVTTTRGGNVFLRNRGDGTFEDATAAAGLAWVAHAQQPTFFDADADGDLDLLVTACAAWTTEAYDPEARAYVGREGLEALARSPIELNRFYRNRGDGTFEDATADAGLGGVGWGGDTAVFDYDDDGDLDVFVANMLGRSQLYQNDGHGRFRDVMRETLGRAPWGTVGAKAFDADGDGRLDLFLVDMHSDMWTRFQDDPATYDEARKYDSIFGPYRKLASPAQDRLVSLFGAGIDDTFFGSALFLNRGGGRFEETSERAGTETLWPWGVAAGDFDGDGDEDAFLPSGMGIVYAYWRSPLLVNRGDGTFYDAATDAGLDPLPGGPLTPTGPGGTPWTRSLRAAAVADLDGDGRLDLVANPFNDRAFLWWNRSPATPWVAFRLRGTRSDRDAVGAVVRVTAGGRTFVRQVHAAGGYLAQSSPVVHVGLGGATTIDRVEIRWPRGTVQVLRDVRPGAVHAVTEPSP